MLNCKITKKIKLTTMYVLYKISDLIFLKKNVSYISDNL